MPAAKKASTSKLLSALRAHYKAHARTHLPWRKTTQPYRILVSELMLQQTQVDRVVPFYKKFIAQFPTAHALARAPLADVLKAWQGLGYNRRAKFLHEAATQVVLLKRFPKEVEEIEKLRGVGHYTARAVAAFAFNKSSAFVETNIRTVLFHHYKGQSFAKISDAQLLVVVEELLKQSRMEPRDFYAAMMDYGSHLKRQGIRLNSTSKHYTKQSKFEGSRRQKNAARLREALRRGASERTLARLLQVK